MALRYDLCGYAVSWQQIVLIVAVLGFCTMEWCGFCEVAISECMWELWQDKAERGCESIQGYIHP